ncbi:MAG TPA: hypothetical protein VK992_02775, partial [Candidatus Caenarcaniphilales bacterium]|nr:hypothetical protein [Candidatus Caenarcaniphilales bacterium]
SPSTEPTSSATAGPRELATGLSLADDPFAVAAAVNPAQMEPLWEQLGQASPPPTVDFEQELVLFLGMSGSSSCPKRLERLFVDHAAGKVFGQWAGHEPGEACTDDLQAQGVLLAVERSLLPTTPFLFSLEEEPICPECPERPDQAVVDPAG